MSSENLPPPPAGAPETPVPSAPKPSAAPAAPDTPSAATPAAEPSADQPETGNKQPETSSQKPETRNQKPETTLFQTYRKPILLVGVLLLIAGVFAYARMPTALFPEVNFPKITLIADAGQQPVDRMMITVTKPLEAAVKRVKGVTVVKSATSRGSCMVDVYLTWDVDVYATKTQLESRVNEIKGALPPGVVITTEAMNQSLVPVLGYTLESDSRGPIALRDAANLIARPLFSQVAGAATGGPA